VEKVKVAKKEVAVVQRRDSVLQKMPTEHLRF